MTKASLVMDVCTVEKYRFFLKKGFWVRGLREEEEWEDATD